MRAFSLYIHIPFCSHKCPYCDFNTYAVSALPESAYVEALIAELLTYCEDAFFKGRPVATIFFGGGTPSLLSGAAIRAIMNAVRGAFEVDPHAEITLEANPFLVTESSMAEYRECGVNRLSFGAQSFDDRHLQTLGREHRASDIERSMAEARSAGFSNLSLDILFGVPGQGIEDLARDLHRAIALNPEHLSTYSLTIEPGTPFFQRQERKLFSLPPDEEVRSMLDLIPATLGEKGYERYEISNYARPGFESRHNTAYWVGADYLGLGAGAHSFHAVYEGERLVSGVRWSNYAHYTEYMARAANGKAVSWRENLAGKDLEFEFFYLGLRRMAGVHLGELVKRFGPQSWTRYEPIVHALVGEGMITHEGDILRLTGDGIALADSVFERFV